MLRELQAFNFKATMEINQLRDAGVRIPSEVDSAATAERQQLADRVSELERLLEDERKRGEEERARISSAAFSSDPSGASLAKQLEESKNLARALKGFLEKAAEREQAAKAANVELSSKLAREIQVRIISSLFSDFDCLPPASQVRDGDDVGERERAD